MKYLIAASILALVGCASTPEDADRQASFLFAVAGGLDAAAETAEDPDLTEELADIAEGARTLAGLVRASAVEGDQKVVAYIAETQQVLRLILLDADPDLAAKLRAVDATLGALAGYYAAPE